MFRIVNFTYLLRYVATLTMIISVFSYWIAGIFLKDQLPIVKLLVISPWVVIIIVFLITSHGSSRMIWNAARYFKPDLYPDLNGTWEGEIISEDDQKIAAKAMIRQSLLYTQIDLHTETAKSTTLETTPSIEAGQYKIYYSYRANPRNVNWHPYIGSTIFDVRNTHKNNSDPMQISGYYYTDRKTKGRISLSHISGETDGEASYY